MKASLLLGLHKLQNFCSACSTFRDTWKENHVFTRSLTRRHRKPKRFGGVHEIPVCMTRQGCSPWKFKALCRVQPWSPTQTLHSPGHLPGRSSVLCKQTDKEYISWKPSRCPTICSLPPDCIALSSWKITLNKESLAPQCGGLNPRLCGRGTSSPGWVPTAAAAEPVTAPSRECQEILDDNDPPSTELLLLGTMELPWYLWLAGNIGIKWAWAQLCVNDTYKQIRFVYLYWMQTH